MLPAAAAAEDLVDVNHHNNDNNAVEAVIVEIVRLQFNHPLRELLWVLRNIRDNANN